MIQYTTCVHVKESFDRQVLLSMFFQWLETSKNRMEHLVYNNEASFVAREKRKCLKIEEFTESHIFGIQFTTSDNYKYAQFVVEILYDEMNQTLKLVFYKELNADSKYIEAVSIPKIFEMLLKSEHMKKDGQLKIQNKPVYVTGRQAATIKKSMGALPLIMLTKNKKCIVNPVKLAHRLFGLAHVLCVYSSRELDMKIVFPNGTVEESVNASEKQMIASCFERLLNDAIEQQAQHYSFEDLIQSRLYQQMMNHDELNTYYQESVELMEQEVQEYRELYQMSLDQFNELTQQKNHLEALLESFKKDNILICTDHMEEKKELVMQLIHKKLNSLNNDDVYRRRDVLQSIAKENDV